MLRGVSELWFLFFPRENQPLAGDVRLRPFIEQRNERRIRVQRFVFGLRRATVAKVVDDDLRFVRAVHW